MKKYPYEMVDFVASDSLPSDPAELPIKVLHSMAAWRTPPWSSRFGTAACCSKQPTGGHGAMAKKRKTGGKKRVYTRKQKGGKAYYTFKGGVQYDGKEWIAVIHVWGSKECVGEPDVYTSGETFAEEKDAQEHYIEHVRPVLLKAAAAGGKTKVKILRPGWGKLEVGAPGGSA